MRKSTVFRPGVMDQLEDRLLLSHASAAAKAAALKPHAPVSAETAATNALSNAYSIFVTNFTEAVDVDLYAPSVSGYASNLPMFSQQLGQELNTLTQSAVKALGPQSTGSTVVTQVRQAINGSSTSSLRSRLTALTLSSMEVGSAVSSYQGTAVNVIEQNYTRVKKDVVAALPSTTTTTTAAPMIPSTTPSS